jgi:uncharacterized protein (TIGR00159 family)
VGWRDVVDFTVLTAGIYVLLRWSRGARALRVTFGILALEAAALAVRSIGLLLTSYVLHGAAIIAGVVLIALFQPELRHAINRLEVTAGTSSRSNAALTGLEAIAAALCSLATAHRGAIVVLKRRDAINELLQGGVPLGGQVSVEILEAIFRKVSPVHDGASVIEGEQITRVGVVLPLSERTDLPHRWGTRHRAAVGLTERSDAIVVVVSEERGEITVIAAGECHPVTSEHGLVGVLRSYLAPPSKTTKRRVLDSQELSLLGVALAFALAIWATLVIAGNTVQIRVVSVEFTDVGRGLRVTKQTSSSVQVRLRGSSWMLATVNPADLVLRVSVAGMGAGSHTIIVNPRSVIVPFGVTADSVSPDRLSVQLAPDE